MSQRDPWERPRGTAFSSVDDGTEPVRAEPTERVTHLTCAVRPR